MISADVDLRKYEFSVISLKFKDKGVENSYKVHFHERANVLAPIFACVLFGGAKFLHGTWDRLNTVGRYMLMLDCLIHLLALLGSLFLKNKFKRMPVQTIFFFPLLDAYASCYCRALLGASSSLPPHIFPQFLLVYMGISWMILPFHLIIAASIHIYVVEAFNIPTDWDLLNQSFPFLLVVVLAGYTCEYILKSNYAAMGIAAHYQSKFLEVLGKKQEGSPVNGQVAKEDTTPNTPRNVVGLEANKVEAALKNAQELNSKLRAALETKNSFVASMSHELRSPLHCIVALASVLGQATRPETEEFSMVQTMLSAGQHLTTMVDEILEYSSLEKKSLELSMNPFKLHTFAKSFFDCSTPLARSGVKYWYSINTLNDYTLLGDEVRFRQVIDHILSNAFKFTAEGHVSLEFEVVASKEKSKEITLIVRIEDTGIGMSPEFMQRVYLPFEQSDNSIRRSFGGTGLGLTISYGLVSLLGGSMDCKSTLGKGTTVTIKTPFQIQDSLDSCMEWFPHDELTTIRVALSESITADEPAKSWLQKWLGLANIPIHKSGILRFANNNQHKKRVLICSSLSRKEQLEAELEDLGLASNTDGSIIIASDNTFVISILWQSNPDHSGTVSNQPSSWQHVYASQPLELLRLLGDIAVDRIVVESNNHNNNNNHQAVKMEAIPNANEATDIKVEEEGGVKALVVDDSPVNRKVLEMLLRKCGVNKISIACDGQEAVEQVKARMDSQDNQFDIVFMDIHMPVLDGREATLKIIQMIPDAQARPTIVACTADTSERKNPSPGLQMVLTKPFSIGELRRTLQECKKLQQDLPT